MSHNSWSETIVFPTTSGRNLIAGNAAVIISARVLPAADPMTKEASKSGGGCSSCSHGSGVLEIAAPILYRNLRRCSEWLSVTKPKRVVTEGSLPYTGIWRCETQAYPECPLRVFRDMGITWPKYPSRVFRDTGIPETGISRHGHTSTENPRIFWACLGVIPAHTPPTWVFGGVIPGQRAFQTPRTRRTRRTRRVY